MFFFVSFFFFLNTFFQFLRDLDDEISAIKLEEESLKRKMNGKFLAYHSARRNWVVQLTRLLWLPLIFGLSNYICTWQDRGNFVNVLGRRATGFTGQKTFWNELLYKKNFLLKYWTRHSGKNIRTGKYLLGTLSIMKPW